MSHPDTLLRFALAVRLRNDPALSHEERASLVTTLGRTAVLTPAIRQRLAASTLQWLEGYDQRCAHVVRLALAEAPDVPWRGHRSTEGILKIAAIVERLQQAQEALPEPTPRRRVSRRQP